ncbi:MAG: PepSY domain-containing protein [Steroidobacteraceae bacterium]
MAASSQGTRSIVGGLVWLHRWTGLLVCLFFALWFASGAVMLFEPFPSLPAGERLSRGEQLDPATIAVSPVEALSARPEADSLQVRARDGQPVYVLGRDGQAPTVVDARSGGVLGKIDGEAAGRIAEKFSGMMPLRIDANVEHDQWIVHEGFDAGRPYHRVAMDDLAGTVLYVSAWTGEVRQRTTRTQRALNSVGAVPHWLYWTAIRQHWSFWDSLVWWVSLGALGSALLGFILGIYRYVQSRARGGSGWRVYVSWWRWHHVLGLTAGVFLLGWILSGWLSMDHGRLFSRGAPSDSAMTAMRGMPLSATVGRVSLQSFAAAGPVAAIQWRAVAGNAFLEVVRRDGAEVVTRGAAPQKTLPDDWLLAGLRRAFPDAGTIVEQKVGASALYPRAEELPVGARLYLVGATDPHHVYVYATTGEILVDMDVSRRAYAWVYYALHTYKVPALAGRDSLRITLMLLLLAGGLSLSVTGVVIAYRRLRATIA